MCAADPEKWDEANAREAAAHYPGLAERMGLDAPIPDHLPPLDPIPGIPGQLREHPSRFITPFVRQMLRHHARRNLGPLKADPVLHWPPRFASALEAIESAYARRLHAK